MEKRVFAIPAKWLFDKEQESRIMDKMTEADVVQIFGAEVVVVNMYAVTFIEKKSDSIVFHFINRDSLIINKDGSQKQEGE